MKEEKKVIKKPENSGKGKGEDKSPSVINYCIDMDGVLAKWETEDSQYDTYQPGYFANRELLANVRDMIRMLREKGKKVFILSSVYQNGYAEKDKKTWLKKVGLEDIPAIFVPYGKNKAHYAPEGDNVLLDDFTDNLLEWTEAGNLGVKMYNGINGTKGRWDGFAVNNRMSAEKLCMVLTSVSEAYFKIANRMK